MSTYNLTLNPTQRKRSIDANDADDGAHAHTYDEEYRVVFK